MGRKSAKQIAAEKARTETRKLAAAAKAKAEADKIEAARIAAAEKAEAARVAALKKSVATKMAADNKKSKKRPSVIEIVDENPKHCIYRNPLICVTWKGKRSRTGK